MNYSKTSETSPNEWFFGRTWPPVLTNLFRLLNILAIYMGFFGEQKEEEKRVGEGGGQGGKNPSPEHKPPTLIMRDLYFDRLAMVS